LLDAAKVEHPEEVVTVSLPGEHLCRVEQQDLRYFVNLAVLSVPDNHLRLEDLSYLAGLVDLDLMCNRVKAVGEVSFLQLQTLNMSYNSLKQEDILRLAKAAPRLAALDLGYNELERLPADLSGFKCLRTLILAGNHLVSEGLLSSLSTLPELLKLDLARNRLPGIRGDSVVSLKQLEELDFSHNGVLSAAALQFVALLSALQVLVISGNPLESREVEKLSATTGALLINDSGGKPAKLAYPLSRRERQ
jgi:Leucine-rich repeat (LRR) protein